VVAASCSRGHSLWWLDVLLYTLCLKGKVDGGSKDLKASALKIQSVERFCGRDETSPRADVGCALIGHPFRP